MASPCEVLVETEDRKLAMRFLRVAFDEAKRIEKFWSRYLPGNIIDQVNTANGRPIKVDNETAEMLNLAAQLWELSEGKFDITSGILRKAWHFDGSDNVPSEATVQSLMPYIGWDKVTWQRNVLTMRPGMQIDFGGIGKEYAVDSCLTLCKQISTAPFLINLGGDIQVSAPRFNNQPWHIGIEQTKNEKEAFLVYQGAVATSGDAYRYLERDGTRYGHVLNARTGWPIKNAPASVTVAGNTCTEAGILSSLALLQGLEAEAFLEAQNARHLIRRVTSN